ncbi:MAG: flagellar assembly protein FliW [Geminicoccaceae bacterium]
MDDAAGGSGASTILFPQGLPGFPAATRFALRQLKHGPEGLLLLQSTDDPGLRFLVLPYLGGQLPLRRCDLDSACTALGIPAEHAAVLLVVTRQAVQGNEGAPPQLFVNLRAPVVLDTHRRTAVQHVLPSPGYAFRFPLPAAA